MNRKERRGLAKQAPAVRGGLDQERRVAAAQAHCTIAVKEQAERHYSEAATAWRNVIALTPENGAAHLSLGVALRLMGDPGAVDALRRAVRLSPDNPDGHINLANVLQEHGHLEKAREASARLLATHPKNALAWSIHVGLKTFAEADPELDQMEALLADAAGADEAQREKRIILEFALGKAWMDVGDVDRAFGHVSRANQTKRETYDYDVRDDVQRLASIPRGVERLKQRLSGPGDPSESPVFVVGMPRSGTTLIEQILASHANVSGGGELRAFHEAILETGLSRRSPQSPFDPSRLGRAYLDRVTPLARGKMRLVDKLPGNFQNLGLIALALPNARIVHCRRDPRDVGLSCYSTRFVSPKPYAYDLAEFGQYYRAYEALMDHWRATLPAGCILDVHYEDVVADLEGQTRRLLAFCGLEWDEACLRFHETRRPVRTASVNQVRRKLYGDSCGRWRAYEPHLRPLIDALGGGAAIGRW